MPEVTVLIHPDLSPHGATFDTAKTTSVCDALLNHGIEIEHSCGKVGACTTCHVVITQGFEGVSAMDENEEDMLDQAWGLQPNSRLSCQARIREGDVAVEIPRYSINHAKEEF
jgi:2Fe-2S ferredoxin